MRSWWICGAVLAAFAAVVASCGGKSELDKTGGGGGGGSAGSGGASGGNAGGGRGGVGGNAGSGGGPSDASAPLAFEAETLAIAGEYLTWGRVDDELRWAPFLCRQPLPGIARPSESTDDATHGGKLYSVFAKLHSAYPNGPHTGQAVVKQSWKTEPVTGQDASFSPGTWRPDSDGGDHFYPYAKKDGVVYRATEPAGLFIMFKVDPATHDTDEGWVYATVSPAGQLTSSGRVAACMGCHETSATHERLFGVPLSPSL
jgi:hypothetical protein